MKPLKSPTQIFVTKLRQKLHSYNHSTHYATLKNAVTCFISYYAEWKFCHRYTHALSPVWNRPPYTRIICEKNFAPDIYENCGAFEICASDWLGVGIFVFVCIIFYICGHRLNRVVFVDWLMSKFGYKSVIKLYKFIVKMWLCICNCMCICVCIWCWLWFCYRLDSVVIRL